MTQQLATTIRPLLALLALFSGVALLVNIVGRVDLRLGLLVGVAGASIGWFLAIRGVSPTERRGILRAVAYGAAAGVIATLGYDISKATFGFLDTSPFDPFHAIHVFGSYLVGPSASETAITAAGWTFHLVNGTSFGAAYALLFARDGRTTVRRAILTGLGWGLFLESFQLALYPGWLNIQRIQIAEFVASSLIGHLIYGITLGVLTRVMFRRGLSGYEGKEVNP